LKGSHIQLFGFLPDWYLGIKCAAICSSEKWFEFYCWHI